MTPLRLLWRVLTGADASAIHDHDLRIQALERRALTLERRADAQEAIRRIVGEDR